MNDMHSSVSSLCPKEAANVSERFKSGICRGLQK